MAHRLVSERRFGVELECGGVYNNREMCLKLENMPGVENIGADGSGAEVRIGPLQGHKGFKMLEDIMNLIRDGGGYVTMADGCHVHHEALDFMTGDEGWERTARLTESWINVFPAIEKLVIPARTRNYWACPNVLLRDVQAERPGVKEKDRYGYDRQVYDRIDPVRALKDKRSFHVDRGDLNLNNVLYALRNGGNAPQYDAPTIEFRIHEGTLDFPMLRAWIEFGQRLIDHAAAGKTLRACADVDVLFKRIKLFKRPSELLIAKTDMVRDIEADLRSRGGDSYYEDEEEFCSTCQSYYYYDDGCNCAECDGCWGMFHRDDLNSDYLCPECVRTTCEDCWERSDVPVNNNRLCVECQTARDEEAGRSDAVAIGGDVSFL